MERRDDDNFDPGNGEEHQPPEPTDIPVLMRTWRGRHTREVTVATTETFIGTDYGTLPGTLVGVGGLSVRRGDRAAHRARVQQVFDDMTLQVTGIAPQYFNIDPSAIQRIRNGDGADLSTPLGQYVQAILVHVGAGLAQDASNGPVSLRQLHQRILNVLVEHVRQNVIAGREPISGETFQRVADAVFARFREVTGQDIPMGQPFQHELASRIAEQQRNAANLRKVLADQYQTHRGLESSLLRQYERIRQLQHPVLSRDPVEPLDGPSQAQREREVTLNQHVERAVTEQLASIQGQGIPDHQLP